MENKEVLFASNIHFLKMRHSKRPRPKERDQKKEWFYGQEDDLLKKPSLDALLRFSDYYKISVDMLLREDLSQFSDLKLHAMENAFEYSKGRQLRILSISVDKEGNENIEYVPMTAKNGYLTSFNDPEFIKDLPKAQLPYLSRGKTLRMFECEGDSMLPLPSKCKVLGEYVEDWHEVKDGQMYIVISKQGYAIKKVYRKLDSNSLTLKSLNPIYSDYDVYLNEVKEIWRFVLYLTNTLPDRCMYVYAHELQEKMEEMRKSVIRGKICIG